MQTLPVKSTPIHYLVEIKRTTLAQGATVLEENNQPVAVLLSMDEYRTYRQWQEEEQMRQTATPPDFASEVEAFEQMRPALQKQYSGQAVAIHGGQVVAAGNDKMSVYARVLEELGSVHCYIEWVDGEAPRRVRLPSAWVKR